MDPVPNRSIFRAFLSIPGAVVVFSTLYAAATTLRDTEAVGRRPFFLVTFGVVLAALAIASFEKRRAAGFLRANGALSLFGVSLTTIAAGDFTDGRAHFVVAFGGAALSAFAALGAVAEVSGPPSFVTKRPSEPTLFRMALGVVSAFALLAPPSLLPVPLFLAWALLVAHAGAVLHARYIELGVLARMRAVIVAECVVAVSAISLSVGRAANLILALSFAVALSGAFATFIASRENILRIERASRRMLALIVYAGPVVFIGASSSAFSRWDSGFVTFVTASIVAVIASLLRILEEPFLPEKGAWLFAVAEAKKSLLSHDTENSVKEALNALRKPWGAITGSPEFWTFHPTKRMTVDLAGYAREQPAEIPPELIAAAGTEPFCTLRVDVLSALEVRRPDLRPSLKWFEQHGAFTATVIVANGEPVGLLVLPHGGRSGPLSFEEASEIKSLADSLVQATDTRGSVERSLAREQVIQSRLSESEELVERLRHTIALDDAKHIAAAERLARPAAAGIYSGALRMAYESLESRIVRSAPVVVVAPAGVDTVAMVARAHLKGGRAQGPLVLVDGTSTRDHDLARWKDKRVSPLGLADRGLLVLIDGASLPHDVQRLIAHSLLERRPPWERAEPLDIALAMTTSLPISKLREEGVLDPQFASRIDDALTEHIVLPRLRDRMEDLRAMVSDRLARQGLRTRGIPLGIDDKAMAVLIEYPFEGEELELDAIVIKLVRACPEQTVRKEHVDQVLFGIAPAPREDELSVRRNRRKSTAKAK